MSRPGGSGLTRQALKSLDHCGGRLYEFDQYALAADRCLADEDCKADGFTCVEDECVPLELVEEQQAPTTTLTVINYCGTPLYFTMAGTMYEVQGNSQVTIEADPGEYPITISMPGGFEDYNGILDLLPGSNALPITCELQPEEPSKEGQCVMHTPKGMGP